MVFWWGTDVTSKVDWFVRPKTDRSHRRMRDTHRTYHRQWPTSSQAASERSHILLIASHQKSSTYDDQESRWLEFIGSNPTSTCGENRFMRTETASSEWIAGGNCWLDRNWSLSWWGGGCIYIERNWNAKRLLQPPWLLLHPRHPMSPTSQNDIHKDYQSWSIGCLFKDG